MHISKKGIRALGIAESYSGRTLSTIAGVVMRKDMRIDGISLAKLTVGGRDATDAVLRIFQQLNRRDINILMLSGCVIAWFNIVDVEFIYSSIGLPTIVVTYEASDGLEDDIVHHFPGDTERLEAYQCLGERTPVHLSSGHVIYIRAYGLSLELASKVCDDFTKDGKIPEPLRVARLVARAATHWFSNTTLSHQDMKRNSG